MIELSQLTSNKKAKSLLPFALSIVILILLFVLLETFGISSTLFTAVENYYEKYGIITLFFSSLVEGFLFFGLYYAGSFFAIAAVIIADGNVTEIAKIILSVWSALCIMSVVNYTIGRKAKLRAKLVKELFKDIKPSKLTLLYFLHPTGAAYLSYTLGHNKKHPANLFYVFAGILLAGILYSVVITAIVKLF